MLVTVTSADAMPGAQNAPFAIHSDTARASAALVFLLIFRILIASFLSTVLRVIHNFLLYHGCTHPARQLSFLCDSACGGRKESAGRNKKWGCRRKKKSSCNNPFSLGEYRLFDKIPISRLQIVGRFSIPVRHTRP